MMRGKLIFLLLIFTAFVMSLNCQTRGGGEKAKPCKYMSLEEAEKILGARVELITNSWTFTRESTAADCIYRADEADKASGKEINLFFRLEESATEAQAKQIYARLWQSNKNHAGIESLSGIGDEAYAHGDQPNFLFILARKGNLTVRIKINKALETTSPEELKSFVKRVIGQARIGE